MGYKVFTVNPGSTSTKVALFDGEEKVFSRNVSHDAAFLKSLGSISAQLPYRRQLIGEALADAGVTLDGLACVAGRGGGLPPMHAGVYEVNEKMCEDARAGKGVMHAGLLGPLLARQFADQYGVKAVVVNPPGTDELCDYARVTGFHDVFRISRVHALNMKEAAIRYAASIGRRYEDLNLITVHLGGGISVTANRNGRMIDTVDISNGDGHMAPTRSGFIPAKNLIQLCFSGKYTQEELQARVNRNGGWVDHLGSSDAREIEQMIADGDKYAELIYNATIYQVAKSIGAYATVLKGRVDAILISGGIAHSKMFTDGIADRVSYIAPIVLMPGEFEMEALAAGAIRCLEGQEPLREYTGEPVWNGFGDLLKTHKSK
ncbi:MAG: butyrate kinase [Parasporobacterium sp.]|nr:butyrate kinase [Parasporobacterium sp.]